MAVGYYGKQKYIAVTLKTDLLLKKKKKKKEKKTIRIKIFQAVHYLFFPAQIPSLSSCGLTR